MSTKGELIQNELDFIYGDYVQCIHWLNHEPIAIWYDDQLDMMCSECGASISFDFDMKDPYIAVIKCINALKAKIVEYFHDVKHFDLEVIP